jgi:hypothetical protein
VGEGNDQWGVPGEFPWVKRFAVNVMNESAGEKVPSFERRYYPLLEEYLER